MPTGVYERKIRPIRIEGEIAYIPLTKGYEAVIDAVDVDKVKDCNWFVNAKKRKDGSVRNLYAGKKVTVGGRKTHVMLHNLLLTVSKGNVVDHIDGDSLNNRRYNLREATHQENTQNRKLSVDNTSGYKGVSWNKTGNKWTAQISVNSKNYYLGLFDTKEEAAAAYAEASKRYHGEFGRVK